MDKAESAYACCWAKKIKAINTLGSKCVKCQNEDIFVLQFHHPAGKDVEMSYIRNSSWSVWQKEIIKCSLLCGNCHHEFHYKPNKIKSALLKLKNASGCSNCKYTGTALDFHHAQEDKKFNIGDLTGRKFSVSLT